MRVNVKRAEQKDRLLTKPTEDVRFLTEGRVLAGITRTKEPEFGYCSEFAVPKDVTVIDNGAFADWDDLQHVRFMQTAYNMGAGVFANCSELESAFFAEGMEKVPLCTFDNCRKLVRVRLPESVRRINMNSFKNCSALPRISFPAELEIIELGAFYGCHALEELDIPNTVTTIGEEAFANCTKLRRVSLPALLEELGAFAFMNCTSLETVIIPPRVKSIPMGAFAGCKNLKRVILPRDIEYIDPYAFYNCDQMEILGACEYVKPTFPMELLYKVSGEISGTMLTTMGYPWLDGERSYRIYRTERSDIVEVHVYRDERERRGPDDYEVIFMNDRLEPVQKRAPLAHRLRQNLFLDFEDDVLPF